jgi:hypothetical protein
LEPKKSSHSLIEKLKSHDWFVQNPAINAFEVEHARKYSTDSLFVIGRNVYQAACGDSNGAKAYIQDFIERTTGLDSDRRKALLDGMLFEIFFDGKGEVRKKFKTDRFNDVFELQRFRELSESFDFIAECLLVSADRFYLVPGKKHSIAVHVVSSRGKSGPPKIKAAHVGSVDVMSLEDDFYTDEGAPIQYRKLTLSEFERHISEEMTVPLRLLTITYDFDRDAVREVRFPWGYTLRKTQ